MSRCEVEWFIIAGGNAEGAHVPRDVERLSASRHVTGKSVVAHHEPSPSSNPSSPIMSQSMVFSAVGATPRWDDTGYGISALQNIVQP